VRIERLDRALLVLVALIAVAVAVAGWLVWAGVLTLPEPSDVVDFDGLQLPAWWPVPVVVVCLIVVALGLWLVWAQVPKPRHLGVDDLELVTSSSAGTTTVSPAALAHLIEHRLSQIDGVDGVTVTVQPDDGRGRLWVRPRLTSDADVTVATRAVRDVVDEVAGTLRVPLEVVLIRVALARRPEGRVV
jgi:hypothetical protein